jgi:hypothetical protein
MTDESAHFDAEVDDIIRKISSLPLLRRRDGTAIALSFAILSAKFAQDEKAEKLDFLETVEGAWELAARLPP